MRTRYLSPETGDYVVESRSFKRDLTAASSVVLALRTPRGSAAQDATFGSRVSTVRKNFRGAAALAAKYALEAVDHLRQQGKILSPTALGTELSPTQALIEVSYTDASTRRAGSVKVPT